jgi:hypothetical protein
MMGDSSEKASEMAVSTINIPVESDLAQVYQTASDEERQKLQVLVSLWLRAIVTQGSLPGLMDEISDRARARGLTPDLLDSLLDNDE